MPPISEAQDTKAPPTFATLRRFLPYLWPAGNRALKTRVVVAMTLLLIATSANLSMGWLYKAAIDRMVPGMEAGAQIAEAGLARCCTKSWQANRAGVLRSWVVIVPYRSA